MTVLTPEVLWAQDASFIYLTVDLTDANATYNLTEDKLDYKATSEGKDYAFTLEFHGPVVVEDSQIAKGARKTFFKLAKKNAGSPWWPRVTKEKVKPFWIKTDFDHWKDEDDDEEEESGADQFGGMDFQSMMQGMGGGGFGSVPEDFANADSDDEHVEGEEGEDDVPPPLEEVTEEK